MANGPVCGWTLEKAARKRGALRIAGLDEVGRGPLFGPVVAAAVILHKGCHLRGPDRLEKALREEAQRARAGDSRQRRGLGHSRRRRRNHRPHQHSPGLAAGHAAGRRATGAFARTICSSTAATPSTGSARSRPSSRATPPAFPSPRPACWPRYIATACWSNSTASFPATAWPSTRATARPSTLRRWPAWDRPRCTARAFIRWRRRCSNSIEVIP